MKLITAAVVVAFSALSAIAYLAQAGKAYDIDTAQTAPEFTHREPQDWINSPPLTLTSLRGRVVLLDFWTFSCWNCYLSFPWLKSVEKRFAKQGLVVIGVHTPEFEHEKIRANVVQKVKEFDLRHPVMIDNDYSYWKAMGNRYWPAFYLIDKQGRIRYAEYGQADIGAPRAKEMQARIASLLSESPSHTTDSASRH